MTALGEAGQIAIVGAGPAGSLLAIYLANQGHDVTVYESRPDLRCTDIDGGRSINLALAHRGIVPLVENGVMDRVDAITIPMAGRMIHDLDGTQTLQPYGSTRDEVIHSVSRTDLNAILLDAAEATGRVALRFEHRCREVDLEQRTLRFTVGDEVREESFGVVFGADGVNSVVRGALEQAGAATVTTEPLGHGYKELTLPPPSAAAQARFLIDPNALHIWPRGEFMLIALANPEGDFTVTLFMPTESEPGEASFATLTTPGAVESFFELEFPDFAALVADLADQFFANPTGSLATVRTMGWSFEDRAVCVGDAAHGIVPFHGQGMNLAMESVRSLAAELANTPDDVAAAFGRFEQVRNGDADAIADMALENYLEMRAGVVDPDYLLKRELSLELEQRFPDKIKARYGMVMFTSLPYAQVKDRAARQGEILSALVADVASVDEVDMSEAERLLGELPDLPPLGLGAVDGLTLADEGRWKGMSKTVRGFRPEDQGPARALIQAGLADRWGSDFDPTANPDTDDLAASYPGAEIVVIDIAGAPAAVGILIEEAYQTGRIVRMSVDAAHRRKGLAKAVVADLLERAKSRGYHTVRVSTDRPWVEAVSLYETCGFVITLIDETDVHLTFEFPWTTEVVPTERLKLRPPTVLDNEFVAGILSDHVVRTYLGGPASVAVVEFMKANSMASQWGSFIAEYEGESIGLLQLEDWRGDLEVSYQLLPARWGNGFGLESVRAMVAWAWENTEAGSLIAVVHPKNELSLRLLDRLGFLFDETVDEYGELHSQLRLGRPTAS